MKKDRNFDDLAKKFADNIYGTAKGQIRQVVVWQDIEYILQELNDTAPLQVLDAGGGIGQISQKIAALGHYVTLCDLSSEMLTLAEQEIAKNGLVEQYRLVHSPIQEISEHIEAPVDLILFHAVMEWLADPITTLIGLLDNVKPGGVISVMFYNYNGLLFKNLICGNLTHIEQGMPHRKRFKLQPQQGIKPDDVYQCLTEAGFDIMGKTGVRTFHDYMQHDRMGDYSFEQVLDMEQKLCRQEPFLSLGRYIHVYARKPLTDVTSTVVTNLNNSNKDKG
ncbi:SAM-dependent methyltransferase [Photobacterium iliopiscarium]|jgi:S-adenosylmethionine-dependent methyltransferase|uniref:tRNA 5-carboxymethoxyuridine methyltransferase n=1 Tax=Photobacterium iliopiscarium TaxID=56192 RepID=A0ABX5GX01_9GAMM|nr:tRNA uridine 5-oxyacetic acid(34) methyltransferase CmoM [Photobacterium iliopiscarium]KJG14723.1 SAM-dependent methyltransferase [Photobacterium iliopiscarium]KJG26543.1 SAM-dependent methyltransferase [Photobacterium iliopiscarium]PST97271.1 tRNA uridine 5-oxyacetic acid(34) methyltransferase CmoM [Photobacterium iliopiscarium]PSU01799.1 tRNA uridine 5-oxyacetic acid(34) methyltransferase CmoM [Photobacterium iliopiscarium]PSV84147.1 tRNA uridine 5-oxyacetic acid(34) methyltransferase Cmo